MEAIKQNNINADINVEDRISKRSICENFIHLLQRAFNENKMRFYTIFRLFNGLAYVGVYTIAWFQLPPTEAYLVMRRLALFLLLTTSGVGISAEETGCRFFFLNVLKENPSYWRSSYYLARMISEGLLLLSFFLPQFFAIYWLIGLAKSASAFFLYLFFTSLNALNAQSLGRLCGMIPRTTVGDTMNIIGAFMYWATFLSGFILFSDSARHGVMYISYQFYAFNGLLQAEFILGNTTIQCAQNKSSSFPLCNANMTSVITGDMVLTRVLTSVPPLWANILVLIGFYVLFNSLSFALLCHIVPGKRSVPTSA